MVQFLISFLVFLTQEPHIIKGGGRSRGGFSISSSLPRHYVKKQKDRHRREGKKEKTRADCKLAQNNIEITILYDAWTISTHDACSNAVRISSILLQNHKIGFNIEFSSKTPKF